MVTATPADLRKRLAADPHRPRFHFLPPANWMNDPNGFIQWRGQWHLFYQHNPFGPLWGNMHWGHAVSNDLVYWSDLPMGLAPTPGGPDESGCFSGCAVDNGGVPTFIYTATRGARHEIQTQCLATSEDGLRTWQKYAQNPVLSEVPPEAKQTRDFRDPFVWREADGWWYMVLGSRIQDVGGVIFLYRSQDLIRWEYLHPLLTGDIQDTGVIWECPNFFSLDDRWVLIISIYTLDGLNKVIYYVGNYENQRFTPISEGILDYGVLYAPLSTLDDQNRRVLIGWLRETRSNEAMQAAGWSGVQCIPRVLTLDAQNRLCMTPIKVDAIRGTKHHFEGRAVDGHIPLEVRGSALDVEAVFEPQASGQCGIALACSADGSQRLEVVYDADTQQLRMREVSPAIQQEQAAPHVLEPQERLHLRILLDGSVIEIIANECTSLTYRIYPTQAADNAVQLIGKQARLTSLDIREMASIWD